jgi:FkbM family methyltransferase
MLIDFLRKFLRKVGFDIIRYNYFTNYALRRMRLFESYCIDLVFDVGANIGIYGQELREHGYKDRIVSFEPLSNCFVKLQETASHDARWQTVNQALGNFDGKTTINVSMNAVSSSILTLLPSHLDSCAGARCTHQEEITVRKVDSIFSEYWQPSERLFLKIDTEGYEKNVIEGALASLDHVFGIEMELSFVPLYEGGASFLEMVSFLYDKGYQIMALNPVFSDKKTGQLLQADFIFCK